MLIEYVFLIYIYIYIHIHTYIYVAAVGIFVFCACVRAREHTGRDWVGSSRGREERIEHISVWGGAGGHVCKHNIDFVFSTVPVCESRTLYM